MPHQHHILQLLPFQHIDDIHDVRLQPDIRVEQMRALAAAGERGRIDAMPLLMQDIAHKFPAPAAVAGAVDQNEKHAVIGALLRECAFHPGRCYSPANERSTRRLRHFFSFPASGSENQNAVQAPQ